MQALRNLWFLAAALSALGTAWGQDVNAEQSILVNNTAIISGLDDATKALREANKALEEKIKLLEDLGDSRDKLDKQLSKELKALEEARKVSAANEQALKVDVARSQDRLASIEAQQKIMSASVDEAQAKADQAAKEAEKLRNKRSWLRLFAGIGVSHSRPPRYVIVSRSPNEPNVLVIRNDRSGGWTSDVVSGVGFVVKDSGETDKEQLWACGPHVGFGGPNPFENVFAGGFFKIYAFFIHAGLNFHREAGLQEGFQVGDVVNAGQAIPTVEQWRVFVPYAGVGVDVGVLADLFMIKKN